MPDSVRLGAVEGYVHEGGWASLQDRDQASGLESDGRQRLDSHPAEPMTQLARRRSSGSSTQGQSTW